jgi:hypothetical protein
VHSKCFAVVLVALSLGLVGGGMADAKPKPGAKIEPFKGVAGVNLGLKRGPITVRRGKKVVKLHTVDSILGKPQRVDTLPRDGITDAEKSIYIATYSDDALTVYYQSRNKAGKLDKKRDAYDKVIGVITYTPRYQGDSPAPGDLINSSSRDNECVPLDKRVAPDGGPRRIAECSFEHGRAIDIIYFSSASPSRDGQMIQQVGIYTNTFGTVLFDSLMQAALEDLGCEDPTCAGDEEPANRS